MEPWSITRKWTIPNLGVPRSPSTRRAQRRFSSGLPKLFRMHWLGVAPAFACLVWKEPYLWERGVPLLLDGKIIGAIGLSGDTSEHDGQCAKAGAEAVQKP